MEENVVTVTKGYKAAKQYSTIAFEARETLSIVGGNTHDTYLIGQLLNEKVKLEVWFDALEFGVFPVEDIQAFVRVSKVVVNRAVETTEDMELSADGKTIFVSTKLVVDDMIQALEENIAQKLQ